MLSYPQLQVNRTNEAKRMDEDAAPMAELDAGESRAAEIGEDSRPVDFTGRLSHGGASGDSGTGPILTSLRHALKMRFTGLTRYNVLQMTHVEEMQRQFQTANRRGTTRVCRLKILNNFDLSITQLWYTDAMGPTSVPKEGLYDTPQRRGLIPPERDIQARLPREPLLPC